MSMDAGGLAQMTYNTSFNGVTLGVPGSSFASRGKGSHINRLSVSPSKISSIGESQPPISASTPRTSRSHLLAGLRTAPKHQTAPSTAPLSQPPSRLEFETARYGVTPTSYGGRLPQTATCASFPSHSFRANMGRQMYSLPEHVLAPPSIDLAIDESGEPMDEKLYAELVSTNLFLAAQQQRLQQQLASVTAAAQQFQGLHLGLTHQQILSPGIPAMSFYQQQMQQGMQPVVQPVPGHPGLYSVYNPMTGQQNFVVDNSAQREESRQGSYQDHYQSPVAATPTFRAEVSPPPETTGSPVHSDPSPSPPRTIPTPPQDVTPLPPPSANSFRRGHKKTLSSVNSIKLGGEASRAAPKSAVFPPTPMTGTFGPGQGRAGEHPIRQPRGPPSLEELVAKPTSKHEGSKNFVTRQRRRAVHNLVRAGMERRGESRGSVHTGSGGSSSPASDTEFTFSLSDGENARRSGSLSSKPSLGSLRAVANGAIGSERKEKDRSSRTRGSVDSLYTAATTSGDEGGVTGGKLTEIRTDTTVLASPTAAAVVASYASEAVSQATERRKMPMFVLSSAEKRKSPIV